MFNEMAGKNVMAPYNVLPPFIDGAKITVLKGLFCDTKREENKTTFSRFTFERHP